MACLPAIWTRLTDAVEALLADEPGRAARGAAARQLAIDRYSWQDIGRRLEGIYDEARGTDSARSAAAA